jgi:NADH-quinone oxidoreductase subunit L
MAASIGLVQNDIKRVLAYSTISQLGYMMLALGAGGYTAGVFHLYTHAFFKALLFLGAGSVIHAMHTNDMQEMGGLYPRMKITAWTMIIASLSIAGVPPLSGFWSKDEIIATLYGSGGIFFWLALATAFMTAFYMFRLIFLTFFGKPRDQERFAHAHESPKVMTVPLMVLAVFSIIGGWVGIPWLEHGFSGFIFHGYEPHHVEVNFGVMGGSIIVALGGIFLAYAMYVREWLSPRAAGQRLAPIYRLLYHKYYFDELYSILIIRPVLALSRFLGLFDLRVVDGAVNGSAALTVWISRLQGLFDNRAVDGLVNLVGWVWMAIGRSVRRVQSGLVQNYALILFLGLAILVLLRLFASG